MIFFSLFSNRGLINISFIGLGLSIIFIIVLLSISKESNGSIRWFNLAGYSFQPTEFLKPFIIIIFSVLLNLKESIKLLGYSISGKILAFLLLLLISLLILAQPNFSMFVGSEAKLLTGLKKKCVGVISATTQITHFLAKKVYEDFKNNNVNEDLNDQLIKVRTAFDETGNLVSAVHTYLSQKDTKYKRLLPPLSLLPKEKEQELLTKVKGLNFISKNIAA